MTLTVDQRWLLLHMGGWEIVGALCSPEGVTRLMQSCWGSTAGLACNRSGAPAWLKGCGWEISSGVITARPHSVVKIKAAEINRYAARLPADIKSELIACRDAATANAVLRGRFCHCGDHTKSYLWQEDAICPPTAKQENDAQADYWQIKAWQHAVLAKALGLRGEQSADGEQLDLFGVTA